MSANYPPHEHEWAETSTYGDLSKGLRTYLCVAVGCGDYRVVVVRPVDPRLDQVDMRETEG